MTAGVETVPISTARLSPARAVGLQVLPGLPALAAYLVFARVSGQPMFALYLAILVAEVPATWAIMLSVVRHEQGEVTMAGLFPWRRRQPKWKYVAVGVSLALLSLILMGLLQPLLAEPIRQTLFGWVPAWAVMDATGGVADMSREMLIALAALGLVSATVVGGVTQELFARGFLLPRTAHLGPTAPALNAAAFAMLHLAAPWSWPVFFLVSLPWAITVYRTRSVGLGIAGHVGMLFVMWVGMLGLILSGGGTG